MITPRYNIIIIFFCCIGLHCTEASASAASTCATTRGITVKTPAGFFAYSTSASEIDLYWVQDKVKGISHNIYRSTRPGVITTAENRIAERIVTPDFHDTMLRPNTKYYYKITAVKDGVESEPSREDADTTFPARGGG